MFWVWNKYSSGFWIQLVINLFFSIHSIQTDLLRFLFYLTPYALSISVFSETTLVLSTWILLEHLSIVEQSIEISYLGLGVKAYFDSVYWLFIFSFLLVHLKNLYSRNHRGAIRQWHTKGCSRSLQLGILMSIVCFALFVCFNFISVTVIYGTVSVTVSWTQIPTSSTSLHNFFGVSLDPTPILLNRK